LFSNIISIYLFWMRLNVRVDQLLSVLAIAEQGSLRGAAEQLGTSQPALSRTLREVERILDVRLFERGPRGVTPTRFGRAVARHAEVIRAETQRTLLDLEALRSAEVEPIRFAVVPIVAVPLISEAILALRAAHPRAVVRIEARPQPQALERLDAGHVDLVLGRLPEPGEDTPRFAQRVILRDDLCVVVRRGHPLARRRGRLRLDDLTDLEWLLAPTGSHARTSVDRAFRRAGLAPPTSRLESEDVPFQMFTVATSDQIGVVPRSQAAFGGTFGLRLLKVDLGASPTEVGVMYPAAANLGGAAEGLIDCLRSTAARLGGAAESLGRGPDPAPGDAS
jgi:DNA-binding transcriptional LysR family regulator